MKIEVDEDGDIILDQIYSGIGVKCHPKPTQPVVYGIVQRDGGIEILLDGEIIFRHTLLGK